MRRIEKNLMLSAAAILLLLLAPAVTAQGLNTPDSRQANVEVRVTASTDSVTVGDRFQLTVTAIHPFDSAPTFPATRDSLVFGDLEILGRGERFVEERGDRRLDSVVYEVTTFALDTAYVPPVSITFSAAGAPDSVSATPLAIPVTSLVPPDAQDVRDLAPLVEFPRPLWPWILLAVVVLLVAGALYYAWRKRRSVAPDAAPEPEHVLPAYEEALERLRRLERADLNEPNVLKPYYVELSELLRTYLARRVGVNAMEQTTRELVRELRDLSHIPAKAVDGVRDVLQLCDLVKFADRQPPPEQGDDARGEAYEILNRVESALYRPDETEPRIAAGVMLD